MKRMAVMLVGVLFLSGCLVMSDSKEKTEGKYIAEDTFAQIEPGKTTASWVKATLGDPSSRSKDDASGDEIWKYNYTQIKEGSGAIFLIFGGTSRKENAGTAFIEFKNGLVTRKWRG
jgi:outer membrane protein assembly factor BamE (lipoprotein component of BamABCDE complex)